MPGQYRPITYLNTAYKILIGVITTEIGHHVEIYGILPEELAFEKGRLEALLIDQAVVDEAKRWNRDLSVVWVDYAKAYDRVLHEWLVKVLSIVGVPDPLRRCVMRLIPDREIDFLASLNPHAHECECYDETLKWRALHSGFLVLHLRTLELVEIHTAKDQNQNI
jgi:hypothetical protein